jgi:prepilin-type N-terminal cleavage/methylation domain-containing protein
MFVNKKFISTGYTLLEVLLVIAIIVILSIIIILPLSSTRYKANDAKRKFDISQIGKFLTMSCFLPDAGPGEYDLIDLAIELKNRYPQYSSFSDNFPKDPKPSSDGKSNYKYVVDTNGTKCALYANLQNQAETVTLSDISVATPGRGIGVFESVNDGWNGTKKFFQYSN